MKKILFIIMLIGAFSLTGKAQSTQLKPYLFNFPIVADDTYWYEDIDLYVDGALYSSFRIGNRTDIPLNVGFAVPVGSEWNIWVKQCHATKHGIACVCPIMHTVFSGKATDATLERIPL